MGSDVARGRRVVPASDHCTSVLTRTACAILPMMPRRVLTLALLGTGMFSGGVLAANGNTDPAATFSRVDIRLDNDLWGGMRQDNNYTNGIGATWTTPTADVGEQPPSYALAAPATWLAHRLLPAGGQRNTSISLGQAIFTPQDPLPSAVIPGDRPYAGVLLLSSAYNVRNEERLDSIKLTAGLVGPWAQGKQAQRLAHRVTGGKRFQGWGNQLKNEPLLNIGYERSHRWVPHDPLGGWGWDAVTRVSGELGNFQTNASVGGELRFGWNLPDDFGSQPTGSIISGEDPGTYQDAGWSAHFFLGTTGTWVARDISLDGNSFQSSHSVSKRPWVAELGYGMVVNKGRWRITLAQNRGTREFESQSETPAYGSVTVGYAFD